VRGRAGRGRCARRIDQARGGKVLDGKGGDVGLVRGEKEERSILFLLLPLPSGRYERNFFFGAGGRGSETLRGLFSNPSWFLYLPLFVPERDSLFFPPSRCCHFFPDSCDALTEIIACVFIRIINEK